MPVPMNSEFSYNSSTLPFLLSIFFTFLEFLNKKSIEWNIAPDFSLCFPSTQSSIFAVD